MRSVNILFTINDNFYNLCYLNNKDHILKLAVDGISKLIKADNLDALISDKLTRFFTIKDNIDPIEHDFTFCLEKIDTIDENNMGKYLRFDSYHILVVKDKKIHIYTSIDSKYSDRWDPIHIYQYDCMSQIPFDQYHYYKVYKKAKKQLKKGFYLNFLTAELDIKKCYINKYLEYILSSGVENDENKFNELINDLSKYIPKKKEV